jgi:ATP-dependent Clp protease adaptor protein ClpS
MLRNMANTQPSWKESEELDLETIDLKHSKLVVLNDEVNTFDWVITCFMEVLKHSEEQSEQLSLIIHHKGRAVVKNDSFERLRPFKEALVNRGLHAIIETD